MIEFTVEESGKMVALEISEISELIEMTGGPARVGIVMKNGNQYTARIDYDTFKRRLGEVLKY